MRRATVLLVFACFLVFVSAFIPTVSAEVRLAGVFGDNMVLQRDVPVAVWGAADANQGVTVEIAGQTKRALADVKGRWSVTLDPMPAGGPYVMIVRGGGELTVDNVLVGEVWLCSGQSNMAMLVRAANDYEKEQAAADLPSIRMFTVPRNSALEPVADTPGEWVVCSPETVGAFSATAFFFGRELHEALDVPVGLVHSSVGGTPVEAWTSLEAQTAVADLAPVLGDWPAARRELLEKGDATAPSTKLPAVLYNAMIAPLRPYTIRGAIWYQGERNSNGRELSKLYGLQLRTMMDGWRADFNNADMPFLYVQLPNFMAPQTAPSRTSGWVMVQEQMLRTLAHPNTGMAVTIDVGDEKNIHPKAKQAVGERLAAVALHDVYKKDVAPYGPMYKGMTIDGSRIVLMFDHVEDGLTTRDGGPLEGFAIAGEDRVFAWADARIEGDTIVVSTDAVEKPVAVRYAWASNPKGNLTNAADLPASPFRTDDWDEEITER